MQTNTQARRWKVLTAAAAIAAFLPAPTAFAQPAAEAPATPPTTPAPATKPAELEPADVPNVKRDKAGKPNPYYVVRHETLLKRAKAGPIGVLFLGDSITAGWGRHKEIWDKHFGAYDPTNFGVSGDLTQHVLWRIENGELDFNAPKMVVLMIGTNNMRYPAEEIAKGITAIAAMIRKKVPDTKLLLLGVFPRGAEAANPVRAKVKSINAELAKLNDGNKTRFLDIGEKFLEADGSISKDVMPDQLHLSAKGYQIWADTITPVLQEMAK